MNGCMLQQCLPTASALAKAAFIESSTLPAVMSLLLRIFSNSPSTEPALESCNPALQFESLLNGAGGEVYLLPRGRCAL